MRRTHVMNLDWLIHHSKWFAAWLLCRTIVDCQTCFSLPGKLSYYPYSGNRPVPFIGLAHEQHIMYPGPNGRCWEDKTFSSRGYSVGSLFQAVGGLCVALIDNQQRIVQKWGPHNRRENPLSWCDPHMQATLSLIVWTTPALCYKLSFLLSKCEFTFLSLLKELQSKHWVLC